MPTLNEGIEGDADTYLCDNCGGRCDAVDDQDHCPGCSNRRECPQCGRWRDSDAFDDVGHCTERCSDRTICSSCAEWCDGTDEHGQCDACSCQLRPRRLTDRAVRGTTGRAIGVEYEFTDSDDPHVMSQAGTEWALHEDGSCGWEIVSPPMCEDAQGRFFRLLSGLSVRLRRTCGIHVHVDARDLDHAAIVRLQRTFFRLQGLLFVLAGEFRLANSYCEPLTRESDGPIALACEIFGSLDAARIAGKKSGERYKSLNLVPWYVGMRDGKSDTTVEFRLHRETDDISRVESWGNLCRDMVDFAAAGGEISADESPLRALARISPRSVTYALGRVRSWRKERPQHKRMVRGATFSIDFERVKERRD